MNLVLTWMATGVFVGWVVRIALGSRRDFGILGDLPLGSLGALIGGWVFQRLGITPSDNSVAHVFVAVCGAATLVGGLRLLRHVASAVAATSRPAAAVFEVDLDKQIHRLNEYERRVLGRVLGRKPSADDPNQLFDAQLTFGQRLADRVATFGGSWTFIGLFLTGMAAWMIVNEESARAFDPFPFILLNLVLSCLAALQAPVIMMSQNRQGAKDRIDARSDYEVNLRAEMEIMGLHAKLDTVREREWTDFMRLQREQLEVLQRIEARMDGGAS
jgi:uncharacterized membrane protein/uncharacterized membrane protein YeaQ/YmgE (transglycosylase-associated protein family)